MPGPKVAVIYYSSTGNTHRMAESVADGARDAGAEVRVLRVEELAPESAIAQNPAWQAHYRETRGMTRATPGDLDWADAIVFGTPTRFGNVAAQLKQFIDTCGGLWAQGKLANKVAAGFVTASNPHGGQESTLLSLYNVFYHWGALIAGPGYTDQVQFTAGGNPYGASATGSEAGPGQNELDGARYMGKRVATVATWLLAGRNA
jgi:NAD(P)H dehydrogenase (quinone)